MKIRTEDEFQDAVDSETAWRKKELSSISSNIATSKKAAKITALRAGIALLYAHWEGLIKNLATYYLCYVSFQNCRYDELKCNFMALSINKEIKLFKESKKASIHNQVVNKIRTEGSYKAKIPYEDVIKTGSNLNSEVFIEIMETIGLDYAEYEPSFVMIDEVLLKMRNEIAHGERLESIDLDENDDKEICVRTTEYYTLELEIVNTGDNYKILKNKYGDVFGWNDMTAVQLTEAWKNAKATDMFTICKDLASGELEGFQMPKHIQDVIDFLSQESEEVL